MDGGSCADLLRDLRDLLRDGRDPLVELGELGGLSIIVDDPESVEKINDELHKVRSYVVGRMGIPYSRRGIRIISLVIDAPQDVISSVAGKVGALDGVSVKVAYSAYEFEDGADGE